MIELYILKKFIVPTLRRASYRWPARNEALKEARISRGMYKCNVCLDTFARKGVNVDHIEPVVDPIKGFEGWDVYINRMFCGKDGFQILCKTCHDFKSQEEKKIRKNKKMKEI